MDVEMEILDGGGGGGGVLVGGDGTRWTAGDGNAEGGFGGVILRLVFANIVWNQSSSFRSAAGHGAIYIYIYILHVSN